VSKVLLDNCHERGDFTAGMSIDCVGSVDDSQELRTTFLGVETCIHGS